MPSRRSAVYVKTLIHDYRPAQTLPCPRMLLLSVREECSWLKSSGAAETTSHLGLAQCSGGMSAQSDAPVAKLHLADFKRVMSRQARALSAPRGLALRRR